MLRKSDKERIYLRDRGICQYCTADLEDRQFQIDHRIPRFAGGSDEDGNLLLSCVPCNVAKGIMTEEEFRTLLDKYGLKWRNRRFKENLRVYKKGNPRAPEKVERVRGKSNSLIGHSYRERALRTKARGLR